MGQGGNKEEEVEASETARKVNLVCLGFDLWIGCLEETYEIQCVLDLIDAEVVSVCLKD